MAACSRPGCTGTIEDGYCNACGLGALAAPPATPATIATPAKCGQAGCAGTIEDGYCNACGMAGGGGSGRVRTGSVRTGSQRTPSTRSGKSSRSTRSTRSGSIRTGRSGAGTRQLAGRPLARPALPPIDPLTTLQPGVVPERKRFCSSCESSLKRDAGFCPKCGQEYSFKPTLNPGDVVAGKYEIKGTVAFGALGWIYLGLDTVLNRWVIMKGLLNSKDPRMLEVAVQEREYLAAVKHPNIVGIYDFVTHENEGFIVMECVNGKTLMTLRRDKGGPLPVAEACSYIIEVLPAFGYLDELGLVYCDFKPENVMVEEETVKLIDLGAVRREEDTGGDIYGSKGYSAPEAHAQPTAVSDLYTVGRALAVLVASFDFQNKYEFSLPRPEECEVWRQHESLYRFLLKATREKPEERFQTAAEMADQLVGVLRSVVGDSTELGHIESALFDPDSNPGVDSGEARTTDGLPRLKPDKDDIGANIILAAGAVVDPEKRLAMFNRALGAHPESVDLKLRLVDELVTLARFAEAEMRLAEVQSAHPTDWRLAWYRGRALLAQGRMQETLVAFESIVSELPGELGPKQALGRAYEASGALDRAISYYDAVSRADGTFTSAALGLARCLELRHDKAGAAAAYRRVPPTSNRYVQAQTALARLLIHGTTTSLEDIRQAAQAVEALEGVADGLELHRLRADIFAAAVGLIAPGPPVATELLLGVPLVPAPLRLAAERELRACARLVEAEDERFRLVDAANAVRPLTLT